MSGQHEVDCGGCGRRHLTNGEQARKERVLRCDCGQFVRLDRALVERCSEPTPPPPIEFVSAREGSNEEEEDDATHMLNTLAAGAALGGRGRSRPPQPSLVDAERGSEPAPRPSTQRSLPPAPARQPSIAPSDKPLWYVDLGGTDLVEMTIEQLILARRTGKLGEGALVWREGMPSWRPVGTLIPAASAHPGPLPTASTTPAPSRPPVTAAMRTPVPSRPPAPKRPPLPIPAPEEPTPQSLASYERPLATLEFALEKPAPGPLRAATRSPLPGGDASAGHASRLPRASLSSPYSTPFPRLAQMPLVASLATPMPSPLPRRSPPPPVLPPPAPVASPSPIPAAPAAPAARGSDRPSQQATLASLQASESLGERPRWVSACIALLVCITASAAGASLVRSLKPHPKPQALPTSAQPTPVVNTPAASPAGEPPRSAVSSAPLVVELESLSVEHKPTLPRAARATPKPAPGESSDTVDQSTTKADDSATESAAPETPKNSDSPAANRASPYGSGSLIDQIKRAAAADEAGQ
ncbi:MAG: GYF domain-containing protein [Pseudomonadota bacterium]